jgi:hypothetical protein
VQLDVIEDDESRYLYALLKVDVAAGTAVAYKAIAGDSDTDPGPGLRRCDRDDGEEQVCIDRLDASVDYARKAIDAGSKPDVAYRIISLQ